jgi:hypothetical protein
MQPTADHLIVESFAGPEGYDIPTQGTQLSTITRVPTFVSMYLVSPETSG